MYYEFNERLRFSRGIREKTDIETLEKMIPGCVKCWKTDKKEDLSGVDYKARLRKGAVLLIDGKARDKGASRYWKHGEPELALETYSVKPCHNCQGKTGWTLRESTNVDLILFTFHPSDTDLVYLIGFQHLRMAFRRFLPQWKQTYKTGEQDSSDELNGRVWKSQCLYIPESVVMDAIVEVSKGKILQQIGPTHCWRCNRKCEELFGMQQVCSDCTAEMRRAGTFRE